MNQKKETEGGAPPPFLLIVARLFSLLQFKCLGGLVAYGRRPPVLNRTRIDVAGLPGPSVSLSGELLERSAVQLDERLADNRLHLAITSFHVHHHCNRHTSGLPLVGNGSRILDDCHITGFSIGNQLGSRRAERIAVICIKVGRSCTTAFIAEEVVLGGKLAGELALLFPLAELGCDHV